MGARSHMFPRLMQIMAPEIHFGYIGRPERASPGEGYPAAHIDEQNRIVTTAIDLRQPISHYKPKSAAAKVCQAIAAELVERIEAGALDTRRVA